MLEIVINCKIQAEKNIFHFIVKEENSLFKKGKKYSVKNIYLCAFDLVGFPLGK